MVFGIGTKLLSSFTERLSSDFGFRFGLCLILTDFVEEPKCRLVAIHRTSNERGYGEQSNLLI
ncbi:hypothetical protein NDA03_27145 [Trichocoleus sp. Lan]|uniref:hypothetical protein n=1 Tax=Trichocoleus sp. Lan TaxID=2933927 RepID=UPI003297DB74